MADSISKPGGETPPRSQSASTPGSKAAEIFRAQIINVNIKDYIVDVRYENYPYSTHFDIPFMVPYVNQNQGEGMNFMPEVGSTVWVCKSSETERAAFVLGWTIVNEGGAYRGGRELLNPGDLHFSTRDGNFVYIRRGGIVQIGATPACQRIYIPIKNIIRDFAENYELSTPGGDLTWDVEREETQGDGHRPTTLTIACKEYADDPNKDPLATLKIGSHGDGNPTILTLQTRDSGGGSVKTKLEISKKGKVQWKIEDDLELKIAGAMKVDVQKGIDITAMQMINITSIPSVTIKAAGIKLLSGAGALILGASAIMKGASGGVSLGEAEAPVVIDYEGELTAWMMQVTALLNGPPAAHAMKGIVIMPGKYKSKDVKA